MTELALKTGMRRGELANLEDIHSDFLMVRKMKLGEATTMRRDVNRWGHLTRIGESYIILSP